MIKGHPSEAAIERALHEVAQGLNARNPGYRFHALPLDRSERTRAMRTGNLDGHRVIRPFDEQAFVDGRPAAADEDSANQAPKEVA